MSTKSLLLSMSVIAAAAMVPTAAKATSTPVLKAENPIEISQTAKRFDLMTVDMTHHRLLAAHSRADALTVVNLKRPGHHRDIPLKGESAGVAVDQTDGKYFVGTTKGVAVVSSKRLQQIAFIKTPGPVDAMVFDSVNDRLYAGHDDGKELWVIDAKHNMIAGHIDIPAAPELMALDKTTQRLYLNIKPKNELVSIDLAQNKIVHQWSTLPVQSPHGLVMDAPDHTLFVAGHSPNVAEYSLPSGKQRGAINIGPGHVDQIAYDPGLHRLYLPSSGRLVVVSIEPGRNHVLGSVPIPKGTHSLAVDPATHKVWISYAAQHSYVQAFKPVGVN